MSLIYTSFVANPETLSNTLSLGNTTGGNNIIISNGDLLSSVNTFASLAFGTGTTALLNLTDGASISSTLSLTLTNAGLNFTSATHAGAVLIDNSGTALSHDVGIFLQAPIVNIGSATLVGNGGAIIIDDNTSLQSINGKSYYSLVNGAGLDMSYSNSGITAELTAGAVNWNMSFLDTNIYPNPSASYSLSNSSVDIIFTKGTKTSEIVLSETSTSINHSDVIILNALKIDVSTVPAYANNAAAVAVLGAGIMYYTDVAGEYILKITH
jgi:hypothetical protein